MVAESLILWCLKNIYWYFVGISFLPLWICVAQRGSLGSPRLAVTDFRTFKECLSAVGYAWMLESNLTIHFKNITPTEILFCPQNLH